MSEKTTRHLGIGIGDKIVTGRIRIIRSGIGKLAKDRINEDLPKIRADDILLFDRIINLDYLLMFQSAGIISRHGGMTSHAAILLREMGRTGIIGVGDNADKLKNGDIVLLNPIENRFVVKQRRRKRRVNREE